MPFCLDTALSIVSELIENSRKPSEKSCYYLVFTRMHQLGIQGADMAAVLTGVWDKSGKIEALKGTYLHKRIELYINALVKPIMEGNAQQLTPSVQLLQWDVSEEEFSPLETMRHIAWTTNSELWEHPCAQEFFIAELESPGPEFGKFLSWLHARPTLSPFRTEWSIFHEVEQIAGQIDSVWKDGNTGKVVIADWKRSKKYLTGEEEICRKESYGRKGIAELPCAHLWDVSWSHYLAQQTLYATILFHEYSVQVDEIILVQCHPDVGGEKHHEVPLPLDLQFGAKMLECCKDVHALVVSRDAEKAVARPVLTSTS